MLGSMLGTDTAKINFYSQICAGVVLIAVMVLGLLPALLGGLLVYQLVIFGAKKLGEIGIMPFVGKIILILFIATVIISLLVFGG